MNSKINRSQYKTLTVALGIAGTFFLSTAAFANTAQFANILLGTGPAITTNQLVQSNNNNTRTRMSKASIGNLQMIDGASVSAEIRRNMKTIIQAWGIPDNYTINQKQLLALNELSSKNEGGLEARFNEMNGTLTLIRPATQRKTSERIIDKGPINAAATAQNFLREYQDLLNIENPSESFTLKSQNIDNEKMRHLKYAQTWYGIPVWGQEIIVHLNKGGDVYQLNGHYSPSLDSIDDQYRLNPEDAIEIVKKDLNRYNLVDVSANLIFYSNNASSPTLSYKVEAIPSAHERFFYFIDANSGRIIHKMDNIQDGSVQSSSSRDLSGATVNFTSWLDDSGTFVMIDPTVPLNDVDASYDPLENGPNTTGDMLVLDARSRPSNAEMDEGVSPELFFILSAQKDNNWDAAATSAMGNMKAIYDYYKNEHGRDSLDDSNANLISIVHYGVDFANAFWNGSLLVFGDGDGVTFSSLASCLDVMAHEMTHGVVENSANLIYENQSGALNESFADVFGVLVDDEDWLLGEDCTIAAPGFLRNMEDPTQGLSSQPAEFSDYVNLPNTEEGDNGGVHINSGIPNHAFYLLATDIGRVNAGRIFYRALTTYLTSSATFLDTRRATEQSATDLFGDSSSQLASVSSAWDEVEVTESSSGQPGNTTPTSSDIVDGDDVLAYLSSDSSSGPFDVFQQVIPKPFLGFDASSVAGPLNSVDARAARPTMFTIANGTFTTYVGTDFNLYVINPDGSNGQVTSSGNVFTSAVSPDGRFFAYTSTSAIDDNIYVVDLANNASETEYKIQLPDFQQGGSTQIAKVRFAESLAFDYTSEKILFDVLMCVPLPDNACETAVDTGLNFWSIGTLDLSNNGKFDFPFPSQPPTANVGFPRFASNNNFISTMDIIIVNSDTGKFDYGAFTYNFETQDFGAVTLVEGADNPYFSSPSFWGDDNFISFTTPTDEAIINTVTGPRNTSRVAVSENSNWTASGGAQNVNANTTILPTQHRVGVRVLDRSVAVSKNTLDFGNVASGESKTLQVSITNNGNSDVSINNISISPEASFSHNGVNVRLPRGEQLQISVVFTAGSSSSYDGTLVVSSSGTPNSISVSLTAKSGSGGGGGIPMGLVLILSLMILRRYCYKTV